MTNIPIKMPSRACARHPRQQGVALLEVLGALAIGAVLLLGLTALVDTSLEDMKGQQASYHQSQIAAAGQKYIAANSASLQTALPAAASLVAVTVPQLISGRFLPAGFATQNIYEQTPCGLIRRPDPAGNPGRFDALAVTRGGKQIPDGLIATIAANAGPGGGYISIRATGTARGANWSSSTASFRSATCAGTTALNGAAADGGRLASNLFHDGPDQLGADFLYRNAVPGRPEMNRMNTPVRMASAALVTMGSSCLNASGVAEAGMAIDASTRSILTCGTGGVWSYPSQWKDPVASYAGLPSSGNRAGDVRMVTGLSRAFTFNGSAWVALAVDQNGNMNVPAMLTAANVTTTQNIRAGGNFHAVGNITTDGSLGVEHNILAGLDILGGRNIRASVDVSAGRDINADRDVHADRDITASRDVITQGLQVNRWASTPAITIGTNSFVPGQACNYLAYDPADGVERIRYPFGTVVTDANRVPLICGADRTMRYANGTYRP